MGKIKFICPVITISDMQRSRAFYENVLGQTVVFDFGENISFGEFAIHQKDHFKGLINKEVHLGGNNFELYFEEDNLEPIVANLKAHRVQFIDELKEQPWRQKVVRFYDPDENIIEIGETMPHLVIRLSEEGLSADKIMETTSLPLDFIKNIINTTSK